MIGSAKKKDGLYWLSNNKDSLSQVSHRFSLMVSSDSKILLWHRRLGHHSFPYLKHLYPNLFINKEKVVLKCDHCMLAKQTHSTYQSVPYTPSKPFYLIHSDIWGPARVPNLNGARWFITFIDDHTRVC